MTVARDTLLSVRLRLPDHVVYRSFVAETVVLNLKTGMYHGLNPTGGHMLDVLNEAPSVRDAAALLVEEYQDQNTTVEADLVAFCSDLLDRELVEIVADEST